MITILDIQTAIAERFGLRIADLRGPRKIPSYAGPRMLAMYLARLLTGASYPEIGQRFGQRFGGRDHSTAINAVRKVRAAAIPDRYLAELHGLHALLASGRSALGEVGSAACDPS